MGATEGRCVLQDDRLQAVRADASLLQTSGRADEGDLRLRVEDPRTFNN
jgi:hypothetical protein